MRLPHYGKAFYNDLSKLVIPVVIQNLLSAAVSSADVIMLNYAGQSAVSAASLASQYTHLLFMILYGVGTGLTMLNAQYYGKDNLEAVRIVQGIAMRFSLGAAVLFALPSFLIPDLMMRVFTNDAELIRLGAGYLRIVGVAFLCWGISEPYLSNLRTTGRIRISTILNAMAFILNIIFNAIFLFGLFGLPKMGVYGVALGTALSRMIQLAGCLIVSSRDKEVYLHIRYLFIRNKILFKDFLNMAGPALLNDISWSLAFSMYSVILGHLGSDVVAANSFVSVVRNFGTVLCFGVASGGGILVGNIIGEGDMEKARKYGSGTLFVTVVSGAIGGLIVLAASPIVLHFANVTDQARSYLKFMLMINTYYVMGMAVNTTLIVGLYRAGGDSRFGMICDTIDMWCYSVPLGFLSAFVFKFPVRLVYFLLCTDEFVKWPWVIRHYLKGTWLKNITRENINQEDEPGR